MCSHEKTNRMLDKIIGPPASPPPYQPNPMLPYPIEIEFVHKKGTNFSNGMKRNFMPLIIQYEYSGKVTRLLGLLLASFVSAYISYDGKVYFYGTESLSHNDRVFFAAGSLLLLVWSFVGFVVLHRDRRRKRSGQKTTDE